MGNGPTMRVELSKKHSVMLAEVTLFEIEETSKDTTKFTFQTQGEQQLQFECPTEHSNLLKIGFMVLLESETTRLEIRGGRGKSTVSRRSSNEGGGYSSSEDDDDDEQEESEVALSNAKTIVKSWGRIPGRLYLQKQAILNMNHDGLSVIPKYIHGQLLVREICKSVHLPLPLPLCRVLLLDSSSPVITNWEASGSETDFEKTQWTFPPATPREAEQYQSEHQLIASGSMCGAHRTISYERPKHGPAGVGTVEQSIRLSETHIVDADDSEKLSFSVNERMPRRGFSVKVKVVVRVYNQECDASVTAELRPVGKNMSNPAAVHNAFLLVLEELENRYGTTGVGLLAEFLSVVNSLPKDESSPYSSSSSQSKEHNEEKKESDGVVKLEDMLKHNTNSTLDSMDTSSSSNMMRDESRPTDMKKGSTKSSSSSNKKQATADEPLMETSPNAPVMIEVKPLPKIRLSLMPSPREEDEDEEAKKRKKKKKKKKEKSEKTSSGSSRWGTKKRNDKTKA